jgi:endonuclease YncB( thermonuclease family)
MDYVCVRRLFRNRLAKIASSLVLILTTILGGLPALCGNYGSVVVDEIVSVFDGDTFRCNIKSLPPIIGENISIRVNGVDTPEIRGKSDREKLLAIEAREFVRQVFQDAKIIILKDIQRPKYFRLLADVFVDGVGLGGLLINKGLAVPYDGGTKTKDWSQP